MSKLSSQGDGLSDVEKMCLELEALTVAQQTLIAELVGALESIYKRINFQQTHSPHRMRLWLEHTKQDAAAALAKQVKGESDE